MKKAHEGLNPSMVRKDDYPDLPEELKEFNLLLQR